MFMFNSNEPVKVAHLQKLANQSLLNGALVMEIANNSFCESKKNLSRLIKRKKFESKKIQIWKYTSTRFCSEQNLGKWMEFQISLSLWELQVIKDLLCIRDIAGISSNRLLLLLIKFYLKPTCWSFYFSNVAWLRVCNFFAKTVNGIRYGSKYASEPQT